MVSGDWSDSGDWWVGLLIQTEERCVWYLHLRILTCFPKTAPFAAGSLQLSIEVVQIDLFPHRTCNASRRHWLIPPTGEDNSEPQRAFEL